MKESINREIMHDTRSVMTASSRTNVYWNLFRYFSASYSSSSYVFVFYKAFCSYVKIYGAYHSLYHSSFPLRLIYDCKILFPFHLCLLY